MYLLIDSGDVADPKQVPLAQAAMQLLAGCRGPGVGCAGHVGLGLPAPHETAAAGTGLNAHGRSARCVSARVHVLHIVLVHLHIFIGRRLGDDFLVLRRRHTRQLA